MKFVNKRIMLSNSWIFNSRLTVGICKRSVRAINVCKSSISSRFFAIRHWWINSRANSKLPSRIWTWDVCIKISKINPLSAFVISQSDSESAWLNNSIFSGRLYFLHIKKRRASSSHFEEELSQLLSATNLTLNRHNCNFTSPGFAATAWS